MRAKNTREDLDLAFDSGKVARAQLRQPIQPGAQRGAQQRRVAVQRLDHKHALALRRRERQELDFEGETAQRRLIEPVDQVGGADKHAAETLHALQHLVDFGHFVGALSAAPVLQKTVGFVEQQHALLGFGFLEHGSHVLFGFADVLAHQVARLLDHQRPANGLGQVFGQRRLAGAGSAVKAQRAVTPRLDGFDDARQLEAGFDVEHR